MERLVELFVDDVDDFIQKLEWGKAQVFDKRFVHDLEKKFSTFKQNAVRHAEIYSEKVPWSDNSSAAPIYVYRCLSVVSSKQEDAQSIFTIKFLNRQGVYF